MEAHKIWINCHKCYGDGLVWATGGADGVDPIDLGGIPPPSGTPGQMTCPLCKGEGEGKFLWGWMKAASQEMP